MEILSLLNQIRELEEEIGALKAKASTHLSKRDTIYGRIAAAESYRFAKASRLFATPKGECPLSIDDEQRLRKEFRKENEKYHKLVVTIGKKNTGLTRRKRKLISMIDQIHHLAEFYSERSDS